MKPAFYLCWAIWWIGGVVTHYTGWNMGHAVCVNLFGTLTLALGFVWVARRIWRKAKAGARRDRAESAPHP
ncbi:hypothetical protein [Caulobacter soli]|uniref:hypothetical protein n=1 Tax=Caulobacter soli TaxID=2708539 RepID=UPI0013EA47DC|nr:hypothetical protein [Caulobacter soli]